MSKITEKDFEKIISKDRVPSNNRTKECFELAQQMVKEKEIEMEKLFINRLHRLGYEKEDAVMIIKGLNNRAS